MKKTKILALLMSMAMLSSAAMPGTLAISSDTDGTPEYECGFDYEHVHNESCYTYDEETPICGLDEADPHAHGDDCFKLTKDWTCTVDTDLEENAEHEHIEDDCYTVTEGQVCGLDETEGHTHTVENGCYEKVLNCEYPEEEHIHTVACVPAAEPEVCDSCGEEIESCICCAECGEIEDHLETCSRYEAPEDELSEIIGPQVGDKIWIKSGSKIYAATDDTTGHEIKLPYHVEITAIETVGESCWYQFEFADISALLGNLFLQDYKWVPAEDTTEVKPEDVQNVFRNVEAMVENLAVKITGEMPQDVQLFLEEVRVPDALMDMISAEPEHIAFSLDITLEQASRAIWQPEEGEPVTVTMDVPNVDDGNIIAVYHEDDDGNVELVGTYPVQDGKIEFEAKSFSSYIGIVLYYQFSDNFYNQGTNRFNIPANTETTVKEIVEALGINTTKPTNRSYYSFLAAYHLINTPTVTVGGIDVFNQLGFDDSWTSTGTERIKVRNDVLTNPNYFAVLSLSYIETPETAEHLIYIRSNLSAEYVPVNATCILFENQTFYIYDETTQEKTATDILTLEEAAFVASKTLGMDDVKILMNDTYRAGRPVEDMAAWKEQATQSDSVPRVPYEELYPLRLGCSSITIERGEGFTAPLIKVYYSPNSTVDFWAGVTIDNKSPAGSNLTAVEITNESHPDFDGSGSGCGLLIMRGKITDTNVDVDETRRGVGVLVTSTEYVPNATAPKQVNRNDGGALELENGCVISNFDTAIKQVYGTTCVTHRMNNGAGIYSITLEDNNKGIALYHNNHIEKWGTFPESAIYGLRIFLEETSLWKSGDIVLASGYEWRQGNRVDASVDGNGSYDQWWTPVEQSDADAVHFQNETDTDYSMGLAYNGPYDSTDLPKLNSGDGWRSWTSDKFHDPYPVIQFQMYTVYNTRSQQWYFTLLDAVTDDKYPLQDNDELVFYGSTNEAGTVYINKNVTIRSSYKGEESWSSSLEEMIVDGRAGDDCTATWNRTDDGNCLYIMPGKTVNLVGKDGNGKDYGTLTFDADGKGRVIQVGQFEAELDSQHSILNMEDGITLKNGNATTWGGAILNFYGNVTITGGTITENTSSMGGGAITNQQGVVTISGGTISNNTTENNGGAIGNGGTLNISGGTFQYNSADKEGDGIYQGGTFNLSGGPDFSGHTGEDVYLPASATTDAASGFYVITKAGDFTFITPLKVTLGNVGTNLYNGRNVVESDITNNIREDDLSKFEVTNIQVTKGELGADARDMFRFIYTEHDGTPSSHQNKKVLELYQNIKYGSVTLEKQVVKAYENDTVPTGQEYKFTVTYTGDGAKYKIGEAGEEIELVSGGTILLKVGEIAYITNIPLGGYTIEEIALNSDDFDTPTWTVNDGPGEADYTVVDYKVIGELTADSAITTVELVCTNIYKRHLADLTIKKTGADEDIDPNQTFLFTVSGISEDTNHIQNLQVVINGNDEITIKDLPVGDYSIKEEEDWSGRYTPDSPNPKEKTISVGEANLVVFDNTRKDIPWLDGNAQCINVFNIALQDLYEKDGKHYDGE